MWAAFNCAPCVLRTEDVQLSANHVGNKIYGGTKMYEIKSTTMQFPNQKIFRYTLAGRELSVEVGKMAGLANGSCLVRYGDTAVL